MVFVFLCLAYLTEYDKALGPPVLLQTLFCG